jgi:hypothetical protein
MITKKYKIGAFYEFLVVREKFWKIQFTVLIVVICLGFPTTLFQKIRNKHILQGLKEDSEEIQLIDLIIYWSFTLGLFKDHRKDVQNYFYFPMILMMFSLAVERSAINWLRNRNGCSYNKLQKFIELDIRREAIINKWPNH